MNTRLVAVIAVIVALTVAVLIRSELFKRSLRSEPADTTMQAPPALERPESSAAPGAAPSLPSESAQATPPAATPGARDTTATTGQAQNDAAAVALKQAATAYAAIRSLRADFQQTNENPLLGRSTTSRGSFAQRQPDRFLMRFSEPAGDIIVSDGEYFWVYYPSIDKKQVLRTRTSAVGGLDLQAQFIGDPTRRFEYTDHGVEDVSGRPARAITLIPREPAGYRSLKVWIDRNDHLVRRFELTNETGVVQHFELSNLQINPALPDALFRFTPPSSATIIER